MLIVKRLSPDAFLPTVGHPGEDLGFDLYSVKDVVLPPFRATPVDTGISAKFVSKYSTYGLIIRDRSSLAAKGLYISAGVVDAGYTGEIKVILTYIPMDFFTGELHHFEFKISRGDKIAQMVPLRVLTNCQINEVDDLGASSRGEGGFGSTGSRAE